MITKQVEVTRVFEENFYADKTIVVNVGELLRTSMTKNIKSIELNKIK